ncbi:predicted protein, partial [Nematostella vectensis]
LVDGRERRFVFDAVLPPAATNRQVYSYAGRPLVDAAFSGFNGTLMAYGQTGTGKTYTMMSRDGVCMQMVHKLFRRLVKDQQHEYKVCMSYLQIYQEKIYDLLNSNHKLEMVLREDPKKGVYVENLTEYVVRSADEVMSLMRSSKKRLIFAETRMNRLSSRSHSVCQITIQRSRGKNTPKNGNCDLAGSERVKRAQVEGERLSELQHINLSLLELGNTIHALSEGTRTHIPFRNSSLTRLLQDSLGGNCKTSFVMCISPTNADKMETRCTLEFGQRALKIKNAAHVNMEVRA